MKHKDYNPKDEYIAVYDERSDGDFDLYMVISQLVLDEDMSYLVNYEDEEHFLLVSSGTLDFPDVLVYSETRLVTMDEVEFWLGSEDTKQQAINHLTRYINSDREARFRKDVIALCDESR